MRIILVILFFCLFVALAIKNREDMENNGLFAGTFTLMGSAVMVCILHL